MPSAEHVVLVDEANAVIGTTPKVDVHRAVTPLHRGFSLFLFNRRREVLLQQRSSEKKTWPLVWSNSCCGHPQLGETNVQAAERRLREELGMRADVLEEVAPYRYCYSRDGVMENEICPILVGFTRGEPILDPREVQAVAWLKWEAFLGDIAAQPEKYSDWCIEEARILEQHPRLREFLAEFGREREE